ncbi:hypothetical protein [Sulfurovum sp.]|nr:hypothetical protein [Sulfurovum sp.]
MDWISIIKIVGMITTVIFLGFLIKELRKSIKESNEGKVSDRCDLD